MLLTIIFLFGSCYEEESIYPNRPLDTDPLGSRFSFTMQAEQEQMVYETTGEKFMIDDPVPQLTLMDYNYEIDHFKIRGQSTLHFRRKSYAVRLELPLNLSIHREQASRDIEKFKLISLVFDFTYIENAIAIGIFREIGLWPVHSFYTEVAINNNTQGVYLFVEDPDDYFMYQQNAALILRRSYHNKVDKYEVNEEMIRESPATYLSDFELIYNSITAYSGKELYFRLSELMDLEQYFQKMAVDFLLRNGDTTDEIFFYMKTGEENVYGIFPWDYDDLFANQPHEVGRNWSTGNLFGERHYDSYEDVRAVIGDRLIWTIEDDLDYKIATDDYLYARYKTEMEKIMTQIDEAFIEQLISNIDHVLQPFYDDQAVIEQSKYDADSTNMQLYKSNLADKKQLMLDRRDWIMQQINK